MTRLRTAFSVVLAALLIVTFQQMASARGMAPAVGEAVLCLGGVQVSVPIDASGAPVKPSHFCPDCTTHAADVAPQGILPGVALTLVGIVCDAEDGVMIASARPETPRARGPRLLPDFAKGNSDHRIENDP